MKSRISLRHVAVMPLMPGSLRSAPRRAVDSDARLGRLGRVGIAPPAPTNCSVPELGGEHPDSAMPSRTPVARPLRQRRTRPATRAPSQIPASAQGRGRERSSTQSAGAGGEERRHLGRPVGLLGSRRRSLAGSSRAATSRSATLSRSAVELALGRQRRGVREDAVVEERVAALDAVRHRDAVALRGQQVRLQQRRQLEPGGALERAPALESRRQASARRRSSEASGRPAPR